MIMTNDEILTMFRQAKNPTQQVPILAELNGCDVETIKEILLDQGVDHRKLPRPKKPSTYVRKKKPKAPKEPVVTEVVEVTEMVVHLGPDDNAEDYLPKTEEPVVAEEPEAVEEPTAVETPIIEDSGTRREFKTGAVRDKQTGKGRMDLMPHAALLEVSKHCEAGALKYGEHNVDNGLPISWLCDSATRHLLKYLDGQTNEDHLIAAAWNLLWAVQMRIKYSNDPEIVDTPWRAE